MKAQGHGADPKLTVILPGYNEESSLLRAVDQYRDELPGMVDFEIIIVDDGSTDGMGVLADEIARDDSRVRVVHQARNLGQAASILHGFDEAEGLLVTHNGVDLPFHPRDVRRVLLCFEEGADVVVVERANRTAYGIVRKIISWCNVFLLRLLFDTPFRDHNFVQFFRRDIIRSIKVRSRGVSTVMPELIFRARRCGYDVVSITADYHKREIGNSTITARKVFHSVLETIRLWRLMSLPDRQAQADPNT